MSFIVAGALKDIARKSEGAKPLETESRRESRGVHPHGD